MGLLRSIEKAFRPITKAVLPLAGAAIGIPAPILAAATAARAAQPVGPGGGVMKYGGGIFNGLAANGGGVVAGPNLSGVTRSQAIKLKLGEYGNTAGLGRPMRRKEFLALIRNFGLAGTATLVLPPTQQTTGLGELALLWMYLRRRRRMTGISARDVRRVHRAQATVRKARRLAQAFGRFTGGAGRRPRRSSAAVPRVVQIQQE